jgi:hypothetical protein
MVFVGNNVADAPPVSTTPSPLALYTPRQVYVASFVGGPIAAVFTLQHNFKQLGNGRARQLTLIGGIGLNVALLAAIPFLPDKMPNSVIPLAYTLAAGSIASSKQMTKAAILSSQSYVCCKARNVTVVILLALVSFCTVTVLLLFALDYLGIVLLD